MSIHSLTLWAEANAELHEQYKAKGNIEEANAHREVLALIERNQKLEAALLVIGQKCPGELGCRGFALAWELGCCPNGPAIDMTPVDGSGVKSADT